LTSGSLNVWQRYCGWWSARLSSYQRLPNPLPPCHLYTIKNISCKYKFNFATTEHDVVPVSTHRYNMYIRTGIIHVYCIRYSIVINYYSVYIGVAVTFDGAGCAADCLQSVHGGRSILGSLFRYSTTNTADFRVYVTDIKYIIIKVSIIIYNNKHNIVILYRYILSRMTQKRLLISNRTTTTSGLWIYHVVPIVVRSRYLESHSYRAVHSAIGGFCVSLAQRSGSYPNELTRSCI